MNTQTPQSNQLGNVYSMYKQNVQKYFENVTKNVPQYFQSMTHLQEECVKACEKTIDASLSMQQEFAKKNGLSTEISDAMKTTFVDINKQVVQANTVQNQVVKTTIDATVQNIKTFNDNVSAFADLNRNIIQSWITPFTQVKN
jgi:arginyl-tRNA synthetase